MSFDFDVNEFEIGDSFDMSPMMGNRIITAVMGIGGTVYVDGNTIYITSLPGKVLLEYPTLAFAPVVEATKESAPAVSEGDATTITPPQTMAESQEYPLVDIAHEEAVVEDPKPAVKPRTRKPKVVEVAKGIEDE